MRPPPQEKWRGASGAERTRRTWLAAGGRLQPRDTVLLSLLHEHTTLTTPQIQALLFATRDSARGRLTRLRRQGWIANFHTQREGRALPTHWVLGEWGNRLSAYSAGGPAPSPRDLRIRNEMVAASTQLEHTDGTHEFFVSLITAARRLESTPSQRLPGLGSERNGPDQPEQPYGGHLARWWSGAHTAAVLAGRLHPDGHGVWEHQAPGESAHQLGFYLEYDRGTETLQRLAAKLTPYRQLLAEGFGPRWPLLVVVPGPVREQHLLEAWLDRLRDPGSTAGSTGHPYGTYDSGARARGTSLGRLQVLTTNLQLIRSHPLGPAGPVWRRAETEPRPGASGHETRPAAAGSRPETSGRLSLSDLTVPAGPAAVLDPGPAGPQDNPLHGLPQNAPGGR